MGPTAAGKTDLVMEIAERLPVEIISDDLERREEKDGSTRVSYSKKSDTKRILYSEGASFSKS